MLRKLEEGDYRFCIGLLPRLSPTHFSVYLASGLSYAIMEEGRAIGFIFAFHLWEKMPFIAHFMIEEGKRGEGRGSAALSEFELLLKEKGEKMVLLSTQSDERAQFLYRRLGYNDCGALFLHSTPYEQPAEVFLFKLF